MRGMLHIGIESSLIGKLHDAAEAITLASGREVGTYMGLEKSGDGTWNAAMSFVALCFCASVVSGFQ